MELRVLFFTICFPVSCATICFPVLCATICFPVLCATIYRSVVCATIYVQERLRNGGRRVSLRPPNKTQYLKGVEKHMRSICELSKDFGSMKISREQCEILSSECLCLVERLVRPNQSHSILKESFCAIRRALKLMQDCCSENWLFKAVEFGKCEGHFLEILLDLHRLPIVVNLIGFGGESLDDMATEFKSIDVSHETKLKIAKARKLDTAALKSMLENDECLDHCLADQLEEIPSLVAPDDIGRYVTPYVTQFNFLKSPPPIHNDDDSGICVFRVTFWNKEFVIKTRFSKPGAEEQEEIKLRKEASSMKECRHPYAVALLGYWEFIRPEGLCELTSVPLLLMESMECDLDTIIKGNKSGWWWPWGGTGGFPALVAINLVLPVAKVMKYLHEIGVVHLDLKPKNILFTLEPGKRDHPEDVSVKLADFGDAQKAKDGVKGKVGTSGYMDPDMFAKKGSVDLVKADVFSFGLVFGEVLTGLSPMEALGCKGLHPKIFYGKLQKGKQVPLPKETPKFVKSIVESCLELEPDERPSFDEICWKLQNTELLLPKC